MATKICTRCGNEIDTDEAGGFCPVCLVKEGARVEMEGDSLRKALEAKLQAQYRLIRLVGRGGMGAVYLARDLVLDREVAIKVVTSAGDRAMYERLRREAKTAARLSHPNIVPLHAFGEVEGMPYFVMGYVRGESLADRLHRDGKLPEDEARRVLGEVADALDHAHRQGVVHRDVKPDNVLLDDETGRALLTDFGVARGFGTGDTLTQQGSVIGTPQYMSPEQAAGRTDIDGRSDIYSLGVMGYAMLAGRLPFDGNTAADLLAKHLTQEPIPIRAVAPSVSDSSAQILERCLEKNPAARWPDARSLKLALGITEESHLPDALHAVEGRGVVALGCTLTLMLIYVLMVAGEVRAYFWVFVPGLMALFVFLNLFVVTRLRRDGFSFGQSLSAIWREPAWWLWWYPRALRRRGNVWERLPATVRYLRWSVFLFAAFIGVLYIDIAVSKSLLGIRHLEPHFIMGDNRPIPLAVVATIVGAWLFFTLRARAMLQRKGLHPADSGRIMVTVPPSRSSFWARPHIAAILAPASQSQTERRTESPHEHMQSILRHSNELSGPLRPLGAQAAVAARQLVGSIEQADRQIADLVRNIEPGEEERLADKIEALAGVEDFAPMRSLLQRQLELVREMSASIEEAKERRNRRVEMLKTLALHVASLRARAAQTPSEVRVVSNEMRALCDEIGRQAELLADRDSNNAPTLDRGAKSTQ